MSRPGGTTREQDATLEREASPALRFGLFGLTVLGAGYCSLVLVLGTDASRTVFAWSLSPLTAATVGGCYTGGVALAWAAAAGRTWAGVRTAVVPVLLVTGLVGLGSVLEVDTLWLGSGPVVGLVASWLWLPVHGVLLAGAVVGLLAQGRCRGPASRGQHPMPRSVAVPLWLAAAALAGCGLALYLAPGRTGWWPWPVAPLDARVLGAWCLALAAGVVGSVLEADLVRTLPVTVATPVVGGLALLAVLRYPAELDGGVSAVLYVLALALTTVGGLALLALTGTWSGARR